MWLLRTMGIIVRQPQSILHQSVDGLHEAGLLCSAECTPGPAYGILHTAIAHIRSCLAARNMGSGANGAAPVGASERLCTLSKLGGTVGTKERVAIH